MRIETRPAASNRSAGRTASLGPGFGQKNGGACGTAKFREETSKKADSAVKDRIAAVHNVDVTRGGRKSYFALHHKIARLLPCAVPPGGAHRRCVPLAGAVASRPVT